ncbi:ABC transporter permease [Aquamicrobium sp. LC103]|uniref:ABC transporter permease n=1 Tax=Aquamicrobium sp. LC103 TaxID=1120658 RepID=UPI00063E7155|nr:ABC transporter permease [Aquamicrobium sp. LC103]TKT82428.1 ABC transporter permease [Aquamicrobium sp. LC103]
MRIEAATGIKPDYRSRSATFWLCTGYLALVTSAAILAMFIAPFGYNDQDLLQRLKPPSFLGGPSAHLLGTDQLGRDVFSRLLFSIQTSLAIAFVGTIIGAAVGTSLGFVAAHFGGIMDRAIIMLIDMQAALPFIILALAALAIFGNSFIVFMVIVGIHSWETYARLIRAAVLSANSSDYVTAMRIMGASPWRIYIRHVLPNVAGILIVQITLSFPAVILLESGLSFVGLGVQPPSTSLGLMIGSGRDLLTQAPWLALAPGLTIFLTCLSVSMLGDKLGDKLNVTLN